MRIHALMAGAGSNAAPTPGATPDPPTTVELFNYSGNKTGITWVDGDASAKNDVSIDGGATVDTQLDENQNYWESGSTSTNLAVRHNLNGVVSAWSVAV